MIKKTISVSVCCITAAQTYTTGISAKNRPNILFVECFFPEPTPLDKTDYVDELHCYSNRNWILCLADITLYLNMAPTSGKLQLIKESLGCTSILATKYNLVDEL
jgi:hypothetical protein